MKSDFEDTLISYIEALRPVIYMNHFDSQVIDQSLKHIAGNAKIIEFNSALGVIDFKTKSPTSALDGDSVNLAKFLLMCREEGFDRNVFILLKDIHEYLHDSQVVALIKRIAEDNLYRENYHATVLIVSSKTVIPIELENYISIFDFPLPNKKAIMQIINNYASNLDISITDEDVSDLSLSFKGLNEFQINQILNLAYQDGGYISKKDKKLILREKEQLIKKAGMLELVNFAETIEDIGGLENLKEWLNNKSKIFNDLDKAISFGVDMPKGIMMIGMPGCGKSLTAKATARLFNFPLVRLDVGRLLGKYIGESEDNMRKALKLSEAISPCVLWIDEIEKAFAGIGNGGGHEVTIRLFGQFLTWMQEKESSVFVVATANDISNMPPEFLRKGRFDELFFVDLPNPDERRRIIEIHLKKRKNWNKDIDTIALIKETEGYNGADLEAVVKDTIEWAFINNKKYLTTEHIKSIIKTTKSISSTLKDKIEQIKSTVSKIDIKPASRKE